ncbi:hypothetical protein SAMN04488065_2153 [Haloplanus vescus]|uniref:Uncharacterized protein n=1 Tax=Haloplanus vescus TaxID=555874 RepID=A0A1H3Z4Q5_9EURY|nr:hypothetical protein [Haloplanus vescus]SEA18647.1 hypothetical protein SAMN04488065_2153 [Haloplanus vescus]
MSDDFETTVRDAFTDRFGADEETAAAAAEKAAAYRNEEDEDLTAEAFLDAVEATDDYDGFAHRYDLAIGDLAAENEDCTDSRAYRLAGFDDLAADPDIGA